MIKKTTTYYCHIFTFSFLDKKKKDRPSSSSSLNRAHIKYDNEVQRLIKYREYRK